MSVKLRILFCLTHIFSVNVQELACSASYDRNETLIPNKQTYEITDQNILSPGRKHIAHAPKAVSNQTSKETKVIKTTLNKCRQARSAYRKETTAMSRLVTSAMSTPAGA